MSDSNSAGTTTSDQNEVEQVKESQPQDHVTIESEASPPVPEGEAPAPPVPEGEAPAPPVAEAPPPAPQNLNDLEHEKSCYTLIQQDPRYIRWVQKFCPKLFSVAKLKSLVDPSSIPFVGIGVNLYRAQDTYSSKSQLQKFEGGVCFLLCSTSTPFNQQLSWTILEWNK